MSNQIRPNLEMGRMFALMATIPNDRREIGLRLRKARDDSGLSADHIAARFGRTRQTYYHWEKGVAMPTADQLKELCRMLRVSSDYLLTGATIWPYDLFSHDEYMRIDESYRKRIENELAGEVMRLKKPNGTVQ